MPGIEEHHLDFADLVFCKSNKNRTLQQNLKIFSARLASTKTMEIMYQPAAYNLPSSCFLHLKYLLSFPFLYRCQRTIAPRWNIP
jgi:hypothetical protein